MSTTSNDALLVYNEVKRFATEKNLIMKDGLVSGELTPQEVLSLGYTLLAWVITEEPTPEEQMDLIGETIDMGFY